MEDKVKCIQLYSRTFDIMVALWLYQSRTLWVALWLDQVTTPDTISSYNLNIQLLVCTDKNSASIIALVTPIKLSCQV